MPAQSWTAVELWRSPGADSYVVAYLAFLRLNVHHADHVPDIRHLFEMPQALQHCRGLRWGQQTIRQGAKLVFHFLIAHGIFEMAAMVGYFSGMASSRGRDHLDTTQHRLRGTPVRLLRHLHLHLLDQFEEFGVTPILGLEVTRLHCAIHERDCRRVRHT